MNAFERRVSDCRREGLYAKGLDTVQVNVGLRCNQMCTHCHLAASPKRVETMGWPTMERILDVVRQTRPTLVDITGGAPELNPHLGRFIGALAGVGCEVQVRTNLSALVDREDEGLIDLFRRHGVRLVASLPCYLEKNVRAQRGEKAFDKSVEAIGKLNRAGYGVHPRLPLDLVYNPGGAFLPGDQDALEDAYRVELKERYGLSFTRLRTITNMPIGRFGDSLRKTEGLVGYMKLLRDSFNPETVAGLMCRRQVSIAWDGKLYDCDFNQALQLVMDHGAPDHLAKWDLNAVANRRIVTGLHCYGCTAGRGSSCGGALVEGRTPDPD